MGYDGFGVGEENAGDGEGLRALVGRLLKDEFFNMSLFPFKSAQAGLLARKT